VTFLRKRKGVSGVISGVFLVAVAVMIFNVLAWQFFQADSHNHLVREAQQREWERFNERLAIVNVELGTVYLNFTVKNYGAVAAHVVDLFVKFSNGTYQAYTFPDVNTWISPGNTTRIIGPNKLKLQSTDIYDFQIGTERGNLFSPGQAPIINKLQPGGDQKVPFTLSFVPESYQYISQGQTWASAKPAWYVVAPKGSYVVFRINITSTYQSDVLLLSGCHMLFVTPDPQGNLNAAYKPYIVKVETTIGSGNTVLPFPAEGQVVPAGKSRYLYFSAKTENGTDATQLINSAADNNHLNFVGLFYKVVNDPTQTTFGATVAIIAIQIKTTN